VAEFGEECGLSISRRELWRGCSAGRWAELHPQGASDQGGHDGKGRHFPPTRGHLACVEQRPIPLDRRLRTALDPGGDEIKDEFAQDVV